MGSLLKRLFSTDYSDDTKSDSSSSSSSSSKQLRIYSVPNLTLDLLLRTLGFSPSSSPYYSAALLIELRNNSGSYSLQFYYQPNETLARNGELWEELPISACDGESICTVDVWITPILLYSFSFVISIPPSLCRSSNISLILQQLNAAFSSYYPPSDLKSFLTDYCHNTSAKSFLSPHSTLEHMQKQDKVDDNEKLMRDLMIMCIIISAILGITFAFICVGPCQCLIGEIGMENYRFELQPDTL